MYLWSQDLLLLAVTPTTPLPQHFVIKILPGCGSTCFLDIQDPLSGAGRYLHDSSWPHV